MTWKRMSLQPGEIARWSNDGNWIAVEKIPNDRTGDYSYVVAIGLKNDEYDQSPMMSRKAALRYAGGKKKEISRALKTKNFMGVKSFQTRA